MSNRRLIVLVYWNVYVVKFLLVYRERKKGENVDYRMNVFVKRSVFMIDEFLFYGFCWY